jgi:hypothetical protein
VHDPSLAAFVGQHPRLTTLAITNTQRLGPATLSALASHEGT